VIEKTDKSSRDIILEDIASEFHNNFKYVNAKRFRIAHEEHLGVIDELVSHRLIWLDGEVYRFHIKVLVGSKCWDDTFSILNLVFPAIKHFYRTNPDRYYTAEDIIQYIVQSENKRVFEDQTQKSLLLLDDLGFIGGGNRSPDSPPRKYLTFTIREDVLRCKSVKERVDSAVDEYNRILDLSDTDPNVGLNRIFAPKKTTGSVSGITSKRVSFDTLSDAYSQVRKIGEGGSGTVFEVKSLEGKTYALKTVSPDKATTEKIKRFRNELDFCEKTECANIVRVIDSGFILEDEKKLPFYVMAKYSSNLRLLLSTTVPQEKVLPYFSQILDGVEVAHLKGVWHRDLKPENILVDSEKDVLLVADFGIAHFEEEALATSVETRPNAKLGNFLYAAPEQRARGKVVGLTADIYALGLILNEMFTGDVPQGAGYKTIKSVAPEYSYLDVIVERMIQQNPDSRFKSIAELKGTLIGHRNAFIAKQRLDELSGKVVPTNSAKAVQPVRIVSVDYGRGALRLELNRVPEAEWIALFQNPRGNYEYIPGKEPARYAFSGNMCSISAADEVEGEQLIQYFYSYSNLATQAYQSELDSMAQLAAEKERKNLENEARDAQIRVNLLRRLNKA